MIDLLPDVLLLAATIGLAGYCHHLSRRLQAFDAADTTRVSMLDEWSHQVDAAKSTLETAARTGHDLEQRLDGLVASADDRIGRMEMLLNSLDDLELDRHRREADEIAASEVVPGFRAIRHAAGSEA
ncbi:hypothetical protein [uncultured Jannaschia sp.]|uniref:hypothetical protein n=1 Tax=uncultured Jannaschia sp. TaxID=293347 RepID=UPI002632483E|nr:hypothetical protein [uncultured Jannaschia sp.]